MNQIIYKERKSTNSMKWDNCEEKLGNEKLLPLWVADMDFEVPECVKDAIKECADFGALGYYNTPHAYVDAFIRWEETCHNYQVKREWTRFTPGAVPAANWLMYIPAREQEGVIITSPTYHPLRDVILNNNRQLVESPLVRTENGYMMDYKDSEEKIMEHDVKLFILCSPHNPVGRVWRFGKIQRVLDICKKHYVYVISDGIHQDVIMRGHEHVVAVIVGTYDDMLVVPTAGTKTFNLAACQDPILVIPDQGLRDRYNQYLRWLRINGGNAFGYIAVQSAYEKGRDWLEQVLNIIETNYRYMRNALSEALADMWISELKGTYLMWIDLSKYTKLEGTKHVIQGKCGLAVDYGSWFGEGGYDGFIRVNPATSKENIEPAAQNIIRALKHV